VHGRVLELVLLGQRIRGVDSEMAWVIGGDLPLGILEEPWLPSKQKDRP